MKKVLGWLLIALLGSTLLWVTLNLWRTVHQMQQTMGEMFGPVQALGTQVSEIMHPTPTVIPDPVTIVHEVRSLARLETVQYTVEKVITAETNQGTWGFLFGDRLLFVAHGIVIAGVDLAKLQPDDLQVRDGVLYVHLPPAEIFVATLDNEKSYVYDRDTGLLTKGNLHLETAARQAAEQAIREAALEDGILDVAQRNAEAYLERFLRSLGFAEVVFISPTATPSP